MEETILQAIRAFDLPEGNIRADAFGNGHINRTYAVSVEGRKERYILQRINQYVFHHPDQVQENILEVTSWLRRKITQEGGDPERETLYCKPADNGKKYILDANGKAWRLYNFVGDSFSCNSIDTPEVFFKAGKAFGKFQKQLADFPSEKLYETIPDFHNTHTFLQIQFV